MRGWVGRRDEICSLSCLIRGRPGDISCNIEAEKAPAKEREQLTGPTSEDEGTFQFVVIGCRGAKGIWSVFTSMEDARSLKDSKIGGMLEEGPVGCFGF